ncbi:hypothetical protein BOX15_Mlig002874g1, partial [Macrostomum lignano]
CSCPIMSQSVKPNHDQQQQQSALSPSSSPPPLQPQSGQQQQPRSRSGKPPKPPEKPLMPYMRYSRRVWDRVKADNPNLKLWEVGKIIGHMWRELGEPEKQQLVDEYEVEKAKHTEAMRLYHNSPQYKAWLANREQQQQQKQQQQQMNSSSVYDFPEQSGSKRSSYHHQHQPMRHQHPHRRHQSLLHHHYQEPEWEDLPDPAESIRQAATDRYRRNHRLLMQILGPARLPPPSASPPSPTHPLLKRFRSTLKSADPTAEFENESNDEKSSNCRLQRWIESSNRFDEQLKLLDSQRPKIDADIEFDEFCQPAAPITQRVRCVPEEDTLVPEYDSRALVCRHPQQQVNSKPKMPDCNSGQFQALTTQQQSLLASLPPPQSPSSTKKRQQQQQQQPSAGRSGRKSTQSGVEMKQSPTAAASVSSLMPALEQELCKPKSSSTSGNSSSSAGSSLLQSLPPPPPPPPMQQQQQQQQHLYYNRSGYHGYHSYGTPQHPYNQQHQYRSHYTMPAASPYHHQYPAQHPGGMMTPMDYQSGQYQAHPPPPQQQQLYSQYPGNTADYQSNWHHQGYQQQQPVHPVGNSLEMPLSNLGSQLSYPSPGGGW